MLSFDEVLQKLVTETQPLATLKPQTLPLVEAVGHILAEEVCAPMAVPPFDHSMMDGYAVAIDDIEQGVYYPVSQTLAAGEVAGIVLSPGSVARILTGAPLPEGADTVIMQEWSQSRVDANGQQWVAFGEPLQKAVKGQHIRKHGSDMAQGEKILSVGTSLASQHIAVLASLGIDKIPVFSPLKVAFFTTGSELCSPGKALSPGKIYNSNRPLITALLQQNGFEVLDFGHVADNLEVIEQTLTQAAQRADVIITTGGVSVGDKDYILPAVEKLGQMQAWKVAMKPGKPLALGSVLQTPFVGLPGNPVAAFSVFQLLVLPYLKTLQGVSPVDMAPQTLLAGFQWQNPGQRRQFLRVKREGQIAFVHPKQETGALSSLLAADGLVAVPEESEIQIGQPVQYYPF